MAKDKMIGWYYRLNGHEFEQAPGDGKGQGSRACCSPWGHKESETTKQLNHNNKESKNRYQWKMSGECQVYKSVANNKELFI